MRKKLALTLFLFFGIFFILPLGAMAAERSLSFGLSGEDVRALQNKLIEKGYLASGKNTGYFGSLTEAALKKFQCEQNIICSGTKASGYGVYGPKTRAALSGSSSTATTKSPTFEFSGWVPYWRSATGTRETLEHITQLTSVMPFGYTVKSNGTLADTAKLGQEPWTSFVAEAKKNKTRVVPTVMWGDGNAIHKILSNTTSRIALEDEIANTVKQNGFDGIDIDFEAKKHETIDYFSTFLKGLYQRMGNKWVYCTIEARMPLSHRYSPGATIPDDAMDYANDYAAINKYCDRVEIMAYDQGTIDVLLNSARKAPYAPVADPAWVETLVNLASQKISKNKIIIGIPTYGYEYTITPKTDGSYQYKLLWPFNPRYATDIASQLGITPTRTSANELGFTYDPKVLEAIAPAGNELTQTQQEIASSSVAQNTGSQVNTSQPFNFLSWSDTQAIAEKVALARKLGVRGVAVFKFDGSADPNMWSVLK
ncbi:MAG: glycosyl hydrolase family 18 protein [Candidatus Pacebacteria bacterium]|nr:glycosyl hydrolase family 18 protein [Candidatus Paceibacterota bacterium]